MKTSIIFFTALFLTVFHWSMTLLHVGPPIPINQKIYDFKNAYINPVLSQNWRLFAPDPSMVSLFMGYQCQLADQKWSELRIPQEKLLLEHYKYRFSYHGKLLSIPNYLARELNNERVKIYENLKCFENENKKTNKQDPKLKICMEKADKILKKSPNYLLATKFVQDLCKLEFENVSAQKMYVVLEKTTPFSKKEN